MYVKASIELTEQGLTVETTNGNMIQNPLVGIVNQSKKHMKDFASEFGMSPVSKARVSAKKQEKESDPWTKFGANGKS
jgi:P27 family predicted phage terminase small subunit